MSVGPSPRKFKRSCRSARVACDEKESNLVWVLYPDGNSAAIDAGRHNADIDRAVEIKSAVFGAALSPILAHSAHHPRIGGERPLVFLWDDDALLTPDAELNFGAQRLAQLFEVPVTSPIRGTLIVSSGMAGGLSRDDLESLETLNDKKEISRLLATFFN
jgi:hypothetical protein